MSINTSKYIGEANSFLHRLAVELKNPDDIDHAGRVTIAVFHTLRERIPVEESMHLISQLPMILKGIYVDGWDINRELNRSDTLDEFLDELRVHAPRTQNRDFGDRQQARDNVKAVIRVMRNYVSDGEMQHVKGALPKRLAEALFDE